MKQIMEGEWGSHTFGYKFEILFDTQLEIPCKQLDNRRKLDGKSDKDRDDPSCLCVCLYVNVHVSV